MHGSRKWVLIVDDESEIRESLKELIHLAFADDVKVMESANGIEATAKITQQMFDCIITDFRMPRKDGRALITSIRQNAFNNRTPVIVLTGFPDKKIAQEHQFIYILGKPFQHDEFINLLTTRIKIGSGSGRLAADILNTLINAVGSFMKELTGEGEFTVNSPQAKAQGQSVSCDYLSKIEFLSDDVFHYFSVLSNIKNLENLAKLTKQDPTHLKKISYALGHAILKYSLRGVHSLSLQRMSVESLSAKDIPAYMETKTGILVNVAVKDLEFDVFASTKARKK